MLALDDAHSMAYDLARQAYRLDDEAQALESQAADTTSGAAPPPPTAG